MVLGLSGALVVVEPAAAATFSVTSTSDASVPAACTDPAITTASGSPTLREAVCVANNAGGASVITVDSATYQLQKGAIDVGTKPGTSISIVGPGATIIGDGSHGILNLDPSLSGGINVTLDGLTLQGGRDSVYGGAAVIGGTATATPPDSITVKQPDSLTVKNSTFADNATVGSPGLPGGAIQFVGGNLTVQNSTFTSNSGGSSPGGAIAYATVDAPGQGFSVTGSTFTGNSTTAADAAGVGGGAIDFSDPYGRASTAAISSSTFTNNSIGGIYAGHGAAVQIGSGSLAITASTFQGNTAAGAGSLGSALYAAGGTVQAHFNRILSSNTGTAVAASAGATVNATDSWWGCSTGTGTGCASASAGVTIAPYLTLKTTVADALVPLGQATTALTAALTTNSAGTAIAPANLTAFNGLSVGWAANAPSGAAVTPATSALVGGVASATFNVNGTWGPAAASAQLDAGTRSSVAFGIAKSPELTAPTTQLALLGETTTFAVPAIGYPVPTISAAGLPTGFTATPGSGSLTVTGSPAVGGDTLVTFTASNSVGSATGTTTIQARKRPSIAPITGTVYDVGTPVYTPITTDGYPAVDRITLGGTRPNGLSFTDNGDGTALISGTPAVGSGGAYPVTVTADNGIAPAATSALTLTVNEAPRFTIAALPTVVVGQVASVPITVNAGFPVATTTSVTGALPAGVTPRVDASGALTLAGTPAVRTGGTYQLRFTARNAASTADVTLDLTLVVHEAPVVTLQPASVVVPKGGSAAFSAAATGFPAPTVQWQVSTTGGVAWSDVPGATATTLSLTAALADDDNLYRAVFTSAAGSATTAPAFLRVTEAPAFTTPGAATFHAGGGAQTFDIAASGHPAPALTLGAGAPTWLRLVDSGGGRGQLIATPTRAELGTHTFDLAAGAATQSFTLTVGAPPLLPQFGSPTWTVGSAMSAGFVSTAGYPALTALAVTGALPAGLSFADNRDGTATIGGAPVAGSGGLYSITLTASNGVPGTASRAITLVVRERATFTSADSATFMRGVPGSFTVTTGHAYPAVTTLSATGAIPAGVTFVDNGDGTATISGTTTDASGDFEFDIAASDGGTSVVQSFTLTLADAPVVHLPIVLPPGDGPLGGVPANPVPGQSVVLTASGYAIDAPVEFGIYSTPTVLGTTRADASGVARVTVTLPAGFTGAHSLVASGTGANGLPRHLRSDIVFAAPAGSGSAGSGGSSGSAGSSGASGSGGTSGLSSTGSPIDAVFWGVLALALVGLGLGARRIRRRA